MNHAEDIPVPPEDTQDSTAETRPQEGEAIEEGAREELSLMVGVYKDLPIALAVDGRRAKPSANALKVVVIFIRRG